MRNPKRIPKILKEIEKIWKKNPDLRFCQLIQNPFGIEDIYHVEDKLLIQKLKDYYKKDK